MELLRLCGLGSGLSNARAIERPSEVGVVLAVRIQEREVGIISLPRLHGL